MLEFLLGETPADLKGASIVFNASGLEIALGLLVLAALAVYVYWNTGLIRSGWRRTAFFALRGALLAVAFLLLLDPHLVAKVDERAPGHVAVLLDDSLSMQIRDTGESSRGDALLSEFAPGDGTLAEALESRFNTQYWAYSNVVRSLMPGDTLGFGGTRSDLGLALERITSGPASGSLNAVVLVTDGAVGIDGELQRNLSKLKANGIPLHVVGVGAPRYDKDLELVDADLPRSVMKGDALSAEITVRHSGFGGGSATVVVEEESLIVAEKTLVLPVSQDEVKVRVPLTFSESGPRRVAFRIEAQPGEILVENNVVFREIQVRSEPIRVLHMEGEPRFEVKFLRRAVHDDDAIELVSLVRTAENKFYRLGVRDASELSQGLPENDAALFAFDALVLGSLGDDLLDATQQIRIREFVSRRGGGLIMLGGRNAFAEGGFQSAPLAGLAPVLMSPPNQPLRLEARAVATPAGRLHPALRLDPVLEAETDWDRLPSLTVVNPIYQAKPGATVLLEGKVSSGRPLALLSWHRYGRGTVMAFPARNTWRWQMHAELPEDDLTHERLWRQLLRFVARPAGERLRVNVSPSEPSVGSTVTISVEALDRAFVPDPDARASLELTLPSGRVVPVTLEPDIVRSGVFTTSLLLQDSGRHELRVTATDDQDDAISRFVSVEASAVGDEFHGAELAVDRLQGMATSTGGTYFGVQDAAALPRSIEDSQRTRQAERQIPLREMPLLLITLLTLIGVEWLYRRRHRLP